MPLSAPEDLKGKALRSLGALPPFSPILNRLLAALAGEAVSFNELGDLIEKDTVLAANLLHLVNSALYARRGTVNSVRHAVSLLGIAKLRNAVLGMSINRMWNPERMPVSWSMARFNLHSAAAAILSDLLAQRLPVNYPEGAFIAGLLHDVGRLLIAMSLPAQHDRLLKLWERGEGPHLDCEADVLGFTHPELSSGALAFWNLPAPIQTAVRYHHCTGLDDSILRPGEIPLSRILDAANQYVNSLGVSILEENGGDSASPAVVESLGLDRDALTGVLDEFAAEYEVMAQFFR
jgi:HD-like signal output (HDOD) protein